MPEDSKTPGHSPGSTDPAEPLAPDYHSVSVIDPFTPGLMEYLLLFVLMAVTAVCVYFYAGAMAVRT